MNAAQPRTTAGAQGPGGGFPTVKTAGASARSASVVRTDAPRRPVRGMPPLHLLEVVVAEHAALVHHHEQPITACGARGRASGER